MAKPPKQAKVITRRKKFIEVEIPLLRSNIELIGNSPEDVREKTIKLDLTRQLKGKSIQATVKIDLKDGKPVANPIKLRLMPYFIRRMIRKRISYVEDSFEAPSQDSMLIIKPFLITRKRVSRAVRKTLRNKCRNWIEDRLSGNTTQEIFNDIFTNKLQKPLSLHLKKTYPLSLCEIRILSIKRPLRPEEIPKKKETKEEKHIIDQMAEIEQEKVEEAQEEIKKTQKKAEKISKERQEDKDEKKTEKSKEKDKDSKKTKDSKTRKTAKKQDKEETKEKKKG